MKLRISGNSIRLRLSRPEVESLTVSWNLQESTSFGPTTFYYSLQVVQGGEQLSASFNDNTITVFMPISLARNWAAGNSVGFETVLPLSPTESLQLLIEKDFKCLDETLVDQGDLYDNPKDSC
jgi:hypothetical protein